MTIFGYINHQPIKMPIASAEIYPLMCVMPWVFMIEKLWIFVMLMSRTLFFSLVFRSLNEASLLEGTLHVLEIDSYLLTSELVLLF